MPKSLSETHFARSVASVPHHSDYPCPRHNSHGQWSVFHFNPKTLDRILVENTHQFYVFSVPCLLRSLPETHFIFSMVCVSHLSTNKFTCLADQEIGVISLPRKRQPRLYFFPLSLLGHKGEIHKTEFLIRIWSIGHQWEQLRPGMATHKVRTEKSASPFFFRMDLPRDWDCFSMGHRNSINWILGSDSSTKYSCLDMQISRDWYWIDFWSQRRDQQTLEHLPMAPGT